VGRVGCKQVWIRNAGPRDGNRADFETILEHNVLERCDIHYELVLNLLTIRELYSPS
jgi:hypothetical protein